MYISRILTLLVVSTIEAIILRNNRDNLEYFPTILSDVVNDENIFDAEIIVSSFVPNFNTITNAVMRIVSEQLPVNCIASSNTNARKLWPKIYASQRTLLIYIYKSENISAFMELKDISYLLLHDGARPKLLFITILKELNDNFVSLLNHMWDNWILDVSILDISIRNNDTVFTIHQYNPFTKIYSVLPFEPNIDWFPNKLLNMHGYPIKMGITLRTGYNTVIRNAKGELVIFDGPDAKTVEAWQSVMNFTVIPCPSKIHINKKKNTMILNFKDIFDVKDVELMAVTSTVTLDKYNKQFKPTQSSTKEKWCVLMPVIYKDVSFAIHGIYGIGMSFLIVTLFWVISFLLKFRSNSWHVLNIFGMVLTVSQSKFQIITISERIVFVAIVIVAFMHTSSLYTELTVMNIRSKVPVEVATFQDLANTGLIPIFYEEFYNTIFGDSDDDLMTLKPLVKTVNIEFDCGHHLMKYMNVCCLMEYNNAIVFVVESKLYKNLDIMVNEKLCFWTPPNAYFVKKYSPYWEKFGEVVQRIEESGTRPKWITDYFTKYIPVFKINANQQQATYNGTNPAFGFLKIIGYGYFISFLTFLGEIFIHRL